MDSLLAQCGLVVIWGPMLGLFFAGAMCAKEVLLPLVCCLFSQGAIVVILVPWPCSDRGTSNEEMGVGSTNIRVIYLHNSPHEGIGVRDCYRDLYRNFS